MCRELSSILLGHGVNAKKNYLRVGGFTTDLRFCHTSGQGSFSVGISAGFCDQLFKVFKFYRTHEFKLITYYTFVVGCWETILRVSFHWTSFAIYWIFIY